MRGAALGIALTLVAVGCSSTTTSDGRGPVTSPPAIGDAAAPGTTAPTPTSGPTNWRDATESVCESLQTDGYETRKTALTSYLAAADAVGAAGGAEETLDASCGPAFAALADALVIEQRRDALDVGDEPVTISDLRCADGVYEFVARNETDHPIGVHVGFRLFVGNDDEPVGSADYPIVIWRLDAGQRQGITGEFHEPDADGYRCNVLARVFDASDDRADAAIPNRQDVSLTGDDPADWFGVLLAREVDAVGSGDPDAAAVTEDIRSTFYDNVLDINTGSEPPERIPSSVKICSGTVDRPEPDLVSFVYFVTYPNDDGTVEGLLRHGLFRRGSDEQWRWLSAAHHFDSPDFWGCGRPGPQS